LSVVIVDKTYESNDNQVLVRENIKGFNVTPSSSEDLRILKTIDKYKKMIRGYKTIFYGY